MARAKNANRRKDHLTGGRDHRRSYYIKVVRVAAAKPTVQKPKREFHPGTIALSEIRRYQQGTDLLIPKKAFGRLISLPLCHSAVLSGVDHYSRLWRFSRAVADTPTYCSAKLQP
jgi:hypothetical protein